MRSEEGDTYSECLYKLSTLIAVSVALHFQRYIISLISEFVGLDGVVMEGRRWGRMNQPVSGLHQLTPWVYNFHSAKLMITYSSIFKLSKFHWYSYLLVSHLEFSYFILSF